jgi:GT2 family glycosyltransferase
MSASANPVVISVVVPVHDNAADLGECLRALAGAGAEVIVVDDASRDHSAAVAAQLGARVVRLERNGGAGAARNAGVRHATGDVLVFVDSDVVVAPDTVARLAEVLARNPDVGAVFGSYDTRPRAPGLVSQYRNLLHHFVHQEGAGEAASFWAGCGAVRRRAFERVGGFDEGAHVRGIEDIELGYRLRAAGERIRLVPAIQATHLKRWTLAAVLRTDAFMRALPWSRLLLARRHAHDHLNVRRSQRASVALTMLATALAPVALAIPAATALAGAAALGMLVLNRRLLAFFARVRGPGFAIAAVPLLWLHYLESGLCYAWAIVEQRVRGGPTVRREAA